MQNTIDLIVLSGAFILLVGYSLSALIFLSYFKSKSRQTFALGITILSASSSWLGSVLSYVSLVATGSALPDSIYLFLFSWGVGIAFPGIIYVTVSILSPERTLAFTIPAIALALVYFSLIYVLYPIGVLDLSAIIKITNIAGIQESAFVGFSLLYALITILMGVIFGLFLVRYGLQSSIPSLRFRGLFMGAGLIVFALASVLDATLENSNQNLPILIIDRLLVALGLIMLTMGLIRGKESRS